MHHSPLARFTQIDYEREMGFIAHAPGEGGVMLSLASDLGFCVGFDREAGVVEVRLDLQRRPPRGPSAP